jgi:hypothetical protein
MTSTTISLRLDKRLLDRIDASAARYGLSRNTYILSWIPDNYPFAGEEAARDTGSGVRERPRDVR